MKRQSNKACAIFLSLLFAHGVLLAQEKWTSMDGKTLEAEFIRVESGQLLVKQKGKTKLVPIPLERLDPVSRDLAGCLHIGLSKWARTKLVEPIIESTSLRAILQLVPTATENRAYLVVGRVTSINANTSGPVFGFLMDLDISCTADFSAYSPLGIHQGAVCYMTFSQSKGGFIFNRLLEKGDVVTARVLAKRGKCIGRGLASPEEIAAAKSKITEDQAKLAIQNAGFDAEPLVAIEKTKIVIALLEEQIQTGIAGAAYLRLSESTKDGDPTKPGSGADHKTIKLTADQIEAIRLELARLKEKLDSNLKPARPR